MPGKSNFLDKVLGRIGRLDAQGLQTVVERLARERAFLETLFNAIEDGVLVVDESGRILYFNEAIKQLFGLQDDVEGQSVNRFLPDFDWQAISALDREGGPRVVRHEFEISYPRPRFVRLYAAPLDGETPGSSGVALILHDATEARQKTFDAIESERAQALTLLAGSVAHEIGNPLNALHIHVQLMERQVKKLRRLRSPVHEGRGLRKKRQSAPREEEEGETAEIAEKLGSFLNVAKGEIDRLDYIITQFLQAIRPSPPQMSLASLNDAVAETLSLLAPELENRSLAVERNLSESLPRAPLDLGQIKQVLVNLIKNAMQAMTTGGLLTVQTGHAGDEVWLSVSDSGGGIPQEKLNRIFEPFFTTKEKGTGLGLMIVQRIVRAHGGRIEIDSRSGIGTTFRIWLPLRERQVRLLGVRQHD